MKLVCDTNVVFSALIAGGKTRELILSDQTDLYAPEFFFTELDSHRQEIEEKSRLSEEQVNYPTLLAHGFAVRFVEGGAFAWTPALAGISGRRLISSVRVQHPAI